MRLRTQLFVVLSLLVIGLVATLGYTLYARMGTLFLGQLRATIAGYANAASLLIDGDVHSRLAQPEHMTSPDFGGIRDRLQGFMAIDPRIAEIYTLVRTPEPDVLAFVVDAGSVEDDDGDGVISELEKPADLGEPYDISALPQMAAAFTTPTADDEITQDKWGWWLSAYAPIRDSRGQTVGIVGLDVAADTIHTELARVRRIVLVSCLSFLAVALLTANLFAYSLARPIGRMAEACRSIGSGDYGHRIMIEEKNEFGLLSSTLNSMAENISRSFDKLSTLNRTANILASTLDLGQALDVSLNLALQVTRAARGAILLVEGDEEWVRPAASQGIAGLRAQGEAFFVGSQPLPTDIRQGYAGLVERWLGLTGCTRCFDLKIKDSLRGFLLIDPEIHDEQFLDTLTTQISIGIDNARLFHEAITDSATGLFIKRYFQIRLDAETRRSVKHHNGISLLMLDIDRFKHLNDNYGHPFGDRVLVEISGILTRSVREGDIVARYGGDEMVVILPNSSGENARGIARRILGEVEKTNFEHHGETVRLTVSIGVSFSAGDEPVSAQRLTELADAALYAAKEAGRNTFRTYSVHEGEPTGV